MFKRALIIFIFLIGILFNASYVFAGTVLSSYKYAWSNNVGYVNLEDVFVDDSTLSGYAWSANAGWIKFNPTQGGVINDGAGNLSGFAWGEGLGWIDFSGVKISTSTGKFSGVATGTLVGTLTFDCPTYCDVRTDWRPVSVCTAWTYSDWNTCSNNLQTRSVLSATPSGCTGGSPVLSQSCSSSMLSSGSRNRSDTNTYSHVDSYNQDLTILPSQSGTYTKDTSVGQILLQISANDVSTSTTFYINEELISLDNKDLILLDTELINGVFYNIYAKNQDGVYVHNFPFPIKISLPVPASLQKNSNLAVYWLDELNNSWVLIPEAVFANNKATFEVNHLTKFAIFGLKESAQKPVIINVSPETILPAVKIGQTATTVKEKLKTGDMVSDNEEDVYNMKSIFILLVVMVLMIITLFFKKKLFIRR